MTFEVKDLTGLGQPATKLIELVSAALGTLYRPRAIQAEAFAKATEVVLMAEAEANAEAAKRRIALEAELKRAELVTAINPDLAARATQRILIRAMEGHENIEAIVGQAMLALPSVASDRPVSPDWRRRFFIEAENVCDADMQFLWGRVLAGEVSNPGSFSIRTIEALRYISQSEAELFRKACAFAMQDGWIAVPGHDLNTALMPFGLSYGDIISLRDLGLMVDGDGIRRKFAPLEPLIDPMKYRLVLVNNGELIEFSGPTALNLQFSALPFSKVGKELQQLIEASPSPAYFKALGTHLKSLGVTAKLGKVVSAEGGQSVIEFIEEMANITTSAL